MSLEERLHELRQCAETYAKAQAERVYLTEFRKSKKAMLMRDAEIAGATTSASQEREAYANPEYRQLLEGLKAATEAAERSRWQLEIARMGLEAWRTQRADQRQERKAYGA